MSQHDSYFLDTVYSSGPMAPSEPEPKNPQPEGDNSPANLTTASANGVGEVIENEAQFVSGLRLAVVIVSLISIALLIMLDMSIIATVSTERVH